MKRFFFLLSALLVVALSACQGNSPAPEVATETPPPARATSAATEMPASTPEEPAATATPDNYPARPTASSPETGYPEAPEEPDESAPSAAYPPGEPVWVIRPVGEQCADEGTFDYASLQEAVSALEEAGVNVLSSESVDLMVCEACGCPTSEHYRAQVSGEDVATARSFGWTMEE